MIRAFIAIEIPKFEKIEELLGKLKSCGSRISVPKAQGIHVTLKFLGDIPESSIQGISDSLMKVASQNKSFDVDIVSTGFFPDVRNPRVLWIGMEDKGKLVELANYVDESMAQFGFQKESRPFKPHITVARVKSSHGIDNALRVLQEFSNAKFGSFSIRDIRLKKSTLTPTGSIYEDLAIIPLSL